MRARFPFGIAAFCLLALSLISGVWLAVTAPPRNTATLNFWVFARVHRDAYVKALPAFEKAHPGVRVNIQVVDNNGLAARLQAAFQADLPDVPDLVEIEISSAGTFFRGPLAHVGFADLTDRIHQEGLWDEMVGARFAPYTSRGRIFGLPHDVHPVMLAYRRDLFAQAGVDADKIQTWDDFIRVGQKLTQPGKRYLIELSDSDAGNLETFLFQRGGGYFDSQGRVVFDNAVAVETMRWYVPLVADGGKTKIGNSLGGGQVLTQAVEDGYFLSLLAPDWRTKSIETDIPRMAGKMALMPLPAVGPGGSRTSTWGGTMLGISKRCKHPDLAWELAKHLYLNKKDLAGRFRDLNILPAVRGAWREPAFREPRPYWSGQPLGKLYADLAPDVPFQYSSPVVVAAKQKLGQALVSCVGRYEARGDAGFEDYVRVRLKQSADEIRAMIQRNPY